MSGIAMSSAANRLDASFRRVLEAHSDPQALLVSESLSDRSTGSTFPVETTRLDEPFFVEMASALSSLSHTDQV